jgi:hypothetical protein
MKKLLTQMAESFRYYIGQKKPDSVRWARGRAQEVENVPSKQKALSSYIHTYIRVGVCVCVCARV